MSGEAGHVAAEVGVSLPTVRQWRHRYARSGLAGLQDAERSGRPKTVDDRKIVEATLRPPPKRLGVTHWSSRLIAPRLGVDHATVARAWKASDSNAVSRVMGVHVAVVRDDDMSRRGPRRLGSV